MLKTDQRSHIPLGYKPYGQGGGRQGGQEEEAHDVVRPDVAELEEKQPEDPEQHQHSGGEQGERQELRPVGRLGLKSGQGQVGGNNRPVHDQGEQEGAGELAPHHRGPPERQGAQEGKALVPVVFVGRPESHVHHQHNPEYVHDEVPITEHHVEKDDHNGDHEDVGIDAPALQGQVLGDQSPHF